MKKTLRILSMFLAILMLTGIFSVMGSAYAPYKGNAINFNDVDKPEFTTQQYASMAVDELDRMLSADGDVLDIVVASIDLTSVNSTLRDAANLVTSVGTLINILGDASTLNVNSLKKSGNPIQRSDGDYEILEALLGFLNDNKTILGKYVKHDLNLGFLTSLISDYLFDVRELAITAIYTALLYDGDEDLDYFDDKAAAVAAVPNAYFTSFDLEVQDLVKSLVLGKWKKLNENFEADHRIVKKDSKTGADVLDSAGNPVYVENPEYREFREYCFYDASGDRITEYNPAYDYYGWFHEDHWVTIGLGGTKVVTRGTNPAPSEDVGVMNISDARVLYDFIEDAMQKAFNDILVPYLNNSVKPWLRELCGVTYDKKYTDKASADYNPAYQGDATNLNEYAQYLDVNVEILPFDVPADKTFMECLNDVLGHFIDQLVVPQMGVSMTVGDEELSWSWQFGSNDYLVDNIVSVAKFVLAVTGDAFFASYINVQDVSLFSDQQIVAYVLRAILNGSVDWMYIPDSCDTLADVGYEAVMQIAWQDIPQCSYTKPDFAAYSGDYAAYSEACLDVALDALMDIAIYNLNQSMDMNNVAGTNPITDSGLLEYGEGWKTTALHVVTWALKNYAKAAWFGGSLNCYNMNGSISGLSINDAWADLDTIVGSLMDIKGSTAVLPTEINNKTYVMKTLIFDYLALPILQLDIGKITYIFERNSGTGVFDTDTTKKCLIDLVIKILNVLFPGVEGNNTFSCLDDLLQNETLGQIVENIFAGLYNRRGDLLTVILPIVCQALGLSDEQEFKEIEIYTDNRILNNKASYTFKVYNGCYGLNTGYRGTDGARVVDQLYTYKFTTAPVVQGVSGLSISGIAANTTLAGGASVDVTLNGITTSTTGIATITFSYDIYGESGEKLTATALTETRYIYIASSKGDDEVYTSTSSDGNTIEYYSDVYMGRDLKSEGTAGLGSIKNYQVRVTAGADAVTISNGTVNNNDNDFITQGAVRTYSGTYNADSNPAGTTSSGTYFLNPYDTTDAVRQASTYWKDAEGKKYTQDDGVTPLEAGQDPVFKAYTDGIVDGVYSASAVINAGTSSATVTTRFHFFDDAGLPSLFNSEVGKSRQRADYIAGSTMDTAWTNYNNAMRNAASLVLAPKTNTSFENNKANYVTYYNALKAAIEVFEIKSNIANSGATALYNTISNYAPYNYVIKYVDSEGNVYDTQVTGSYPFAASKEYDEDGYNFFGVRDYVPHTYKKFRDIKNRAQDIVNRDVNYYFAPTPPEVPGPDASYYEVQDYDKALTAFKANFANYLESRANRAPVGALELAYSQHMVSLMGSRLIPLQADLSKLQAAYDLYFYYKNPTTGVITTGTVSGTDGAIANGNTLGVYTDSSWAAYVRACEFAKKTLAIDPDDMNNDGSYKLKPSRVNTAISELIESYKKLIKGLDTTPLYNKVSEYTEVVEDANFVNDYTEESRNALTNVLREANEFIESQPAKTEANEDRMFELMGALTAAYNGLVASAATEFVPEVATSFEDWTFADLNWSIYYPGPVVDEEAAINIYWCETEDEEYIKTISGLGFLEYDDETITEAIFPNLTPEVTEATGIHAEYEYTSLGVISTGSIISIVDANDNVIDQYLVVNYGDINGDGYVDYSTDSLQSFNMCNQIGIWGGTEVGPTPDMGWTALAKFLACDLDNTLGLDPFDYSLLAFTVTGNIVDCGYYEAWSGESRIMSIETYADLYDLDI